MLAYFIQNLFGSQQQQLFFGCVVVTVVISIVLHELAHAYHHRVLGYDDERIVAAYQRALNSGQYEEVLRYSGVRERHYGLNNEREYFAESTEAYFGINDYFPFVRAELLAHDAGMHRLLEEIWGKPPSAQDPVEVAAE